LTGCAGEQFASILRSIGFRSFEMKRSEFIASPSAVESPQQRTPPSLHGIPEIAAEGRASPAIGGEAEAPVDVLSAWPEAPSADATPLDNAQPEIPPDELCSDVSGAEPGAASAAPPALATSSEEEKKIEMIVVWRPNKSAVSRRGTSDRIRRNRDHAPKSEHLTIGPPDRPDNAGRSPAAAPMGKRSKSRHKEPPLSLAPPDSRKAATPPPGSAGRRETVRFDEKHRQTASDRDMPPSYPASERQPRAKVDPNSPFAKLLELRSLLEGQANKRP